MVLAADAAAQAAGLRVGMPATKAQVLVPGLAIQDADPSADADAIDRLALWMLQRFAPIVAADLPDGTPRLRHGEFPVRLSGADEESRGRGTGNSRQTRRAGELGARARNG